MYFSPSELAEYKEKYRENALTAKDRGIGFHLTFEDWIGLWSEHIKERGPYKGQYVLCRKNDLGDYVLGNCYVATKSHNSSVRGYMETRTNCSAIGNYFDQRGQAYGRQSFAGGHRPTALGRSIFVANREESPGAMRDAVRGLVAVYRAKYRREDRDLAEKVVRQCLYEYMNPRYYSDEMRARAMNVSYGLVKRLAGKFRWMLDEITALNKPEKNVA